MNYKNQYQRKAHQEIDFIFLTLLPQAGLSVREEQVKLSHQMLDTLLEGKIALCDAGVGIGKTYAYLVACVLMRKYAAAMGNGWVCDKRPVVISTSSIALQEAIIQEYIPFLSDIFLATGLIGSPLKARSILFVITVWKSAWRLSGISLKMRRRKKPCFL